MYRVYTSDRYDFQDNETLYYFISIPLLHYHNHDPNRPIVRRSRLYPKNFILYPLLIILSVLLIKYGTFGFQYSWPVLPRFRFRSDASIEIGDVAPKKVFELNPTTKASELDGKPIVWQYWNDDRPPLYVRLMMEALQCRNPEFKLIQVHESSVFDYLPDLKLSKDTFRALQSTHQTDVFRLAILLKYGGIYTDADIYPLDKIYPLYSYLERYDLVIGDWATFDLAFGGMGPSRANVSLLRVWHEKQLSVIEANADQLDQLESTAILYDVEQGIGEEAISGRSKILRYNGAKTNNQLIDKGLQDSANFLWSNNSDKILPLNWTPFLFVWGEKMRKLYANITDISELFPTNETLYSVFVGCALLDCRDQFTGLLSNEITSTPIGQLDVNKVLSILEKVNKTICDSIRNQPIFDLEKYVIREDDKGPVNRRTGSGMVAGGD